MEVEAAHPHGDGTRIPRGDTAAGAILSPTFSCILSLISTTIVTCGDPIGRQNFVKNCQHSAPGADSRTRIIQPVTALEGDQSGGTSGGKTGLWLGRILLRSFQGLVVLLAISYAADYAVFRYRLAANRQPFGSVTVENYDAVLQKNGKSELIFNPPVQQTCVHSLFPHAGDPPCWFLSRHAEQRTDI